MDGRFYLDINRFARDSAWLHGFMRLYASYLGLLLAALCVGAALLLSFRDGGSESRERSLPLFWALGASALAAGVVEIVQHIIARPAPYVAFPGAEVLLSRTGTPSMPNLWTVLATGAVLGLLAARQWVLAGIATICGALLGYSVIYVGTSYPGDVLAGAGFAVVILAVCLPVLIALRGRVELSGTLKLVPATPLSGPAAQPVSLRETGSVRLLSDSQIRPQSSARLNGVAQRGVSSS